MKKIDYLLLALALGLGALTTTMVLSAGLAASSAFILGTFLSTAILVPFGGQHRVRLVAVATLPPFLVCDLFSLIYDTYTNRHSYPHHDNLLWRLGDYAPYFALDLVVTVGIPMSIAYWVQRRSSRRAL